MRCFYLCPKSLLDITPPTGVWAAMPLPGAPNRCLVVVQQWIDESTQDGWEELPGVIELQPEMLNNPAPDEIIQALAPWGSFTGMTLRGVFGLVRRRWPAWRF